MSAGIFLGLGSNQNNPLNQIRAGIAALQGYHGIAVLAQSKFYGSKALGKIDASRGSLPTEINEHQGDFVNAVVQIETALTPSALLRAVLAIEAQLGRSRLQRWGDRTLDIDILLYNNVQLEQADLTIPHPRLHMRRFVLEPLCELAPNLVLPNGVCAASQLDLHAQQPLWEINVDAN